MYQDQKIAVPALLDTYLGRERIPTWAELDPLYRLRYGGMRVLRKIQLHSCALRILEARERPAYIRKIVVWLLRRLGSFSGRAEADGTAVLTP